MFSVIMGVVSLVAIIVSFFSRTWSWIIVAIALVFMLIQAWSTSTRYRGKPQDKLSPEANKLFQRYAHYFLMPFAGRDFGSASAILAWSGIIVTIIGLFHHFWLGILFGLVNMIIELLLAQFFNPAFTFNSREKIVHDEIISFLKSRKKQRRFESTTITKAPASSNKGTDYLKETKACPYCGNSIAVDVLRCPDCGKYAQKCANHPRRQAIDTCVECGQFLCRECSGEGEGDTYCPECFSKLPEDESMAESQIVKEKETSKAKKYLEPIPEGGIHEGVEMGLFKRNKILSSDEIALILIGLSGESVKAAAKRLKSHLDSPDMIIWRNVEAELLCFSWFSIDYWMSDLVHPAEKSKALRLAFYNHCQNIFSSSEERSALKERMNSYGQLVISHLSDEILYIRFGKMLAEYCGQPEPWIYFILVAPELFNQAMTGVSGSYALVKQMSS